MNLLKQPGDGTNVLLEAINAATKSIEIVIFRFDRREIETALRAAAARGVFVHALVTYTNRGGEKNLRKLEHRFLEAGVTVARTAGDLTRYHDKFMIVDRKRLFLLAFNYTTMDIDHSRSFGVVTEDPSLVEEAGKLFEADTTRQAYTSGLDSFIVSPVNARRLLTDFLEGAQERLWIYDPKITDVQMIHLLQARAQAGVDVRVIGRVSEKAADLPVRKLSEMRLHTRTIIRDQQHAFVGSQSLRKEELDQRREVGLIIVDASIVEALAATFESDWKATDLVPEPAEVAPSPKVVKKAVKALLKDLPPLSPLIKEAVQELAKDPNNGEESLSVERIEETVKSAIKEAVQDSVAQAVLTGSKKE